MKSQVSESSGKVRLANIVDSNELSDVIIKASESVKDADFTDQGWNTLLRTNTPKAFVKRLENPNYFAFVYETENRIVGYLAMLDYEKIDHMFVLPSFRRQGISEMLWITAKQHCLRHHHSPLFWVRSSSFAKPVYESFGFQAKGAKETINGISFQYMELAD